MKLDLKNGRDFSTKTRVWLFHPSSCLMLKDHKTRRQRMNNKVYVYVLICYGKLISKSMSCNAITHSVIYICS